MGDAYCHLKTSSRVGLRNNGGEIVEVQGGHIVRATGRKDRHSKVCTAKGPRDRRVRLSAHTAIQFYDVQDRLGYDRPSKAVDWLIKKAKAAIDELAELPPWHPTSGSMAMQQEQQQESTHQKRHFEVAVTINAGPSSKRAISMLGIEDEQLQMTKDRREDNNNNSQSFVPSSMDSDAIDDTLKSFFPMGASADSDSSAAQFNQSFPLPEMLSSEDLRLSLQSFQDPMLLHHQHNNPQTQHHSYASQDHYHPLFSGNTPMGFDVSGWSENQRMLAAWNACGDSSPAGGGAYMFSLPTTQPLLQPFGQNQMFSQRGPLQSSNTPSIRAWVDPTMAAITMAATRDSNQQIETGIAGFSGFRIPARIQGEEEEHDGFSYKLSSDSLH